MASLSSSLAACSSSSSSAGSSGSQPPAARSSKSVASLSSSLAACSSSSSSAGSSGLQPSAAGHAEHSDAFSGSSASSVCALEATVKYKRPKRPCPFCGVMQLHLNRHIVRQHKDQQSVTECLVLPKSEQRHVFDKFRKQGILNTNRQLIAASADTTSLLRERRQTTDSKVEMCGRCFGFFSKETIYKHGKTCTHGTEMSSAANIPSKLLLDVEADRSEFSRQILIHLRDDDIGALCCSDRLIIKVGRRKFQTSMKKDRKLVMADMRRLARLLIAFREASNDSTLRGEDMLDRSRFAQLEEALDTANKTSSAGLNVALGYLLKWSAKVMKGVYLTDKEDEKAAEVDRFLSVLDLNWGHLFAGSVSEMELKRQERLRKPAELPIEEDVVSLREFTVRQLQSLTTDVYKLWTATDFKSLRTLLVCRLTLFNARRGGEPAKLLLTEWQDADEGSWVDPARTQHR